MNRRRQRGLSLIEVLVSGALLLIGLSAVFASYSSATRLIAHNAAVTNALQLGEATLEELIARQRGDEQLSLGTHGPRTYTASGALVEARDPSGRFTLTWTVQGYAAMAGMREVTVTTAWNEGATKVSTSLTTWRK